MNRTAIIALAALATPAMADTHAHIGILGTTGDSGPVLEIRAGYLASEGAYSINDQRHLMHGDGRAELSGNTVQAGGAFDGWYLIDVGNINPTADFFASTLGTADTYYEMASVVSVDGSGAEGAFGFFFSEHDHGRHDVVVRSDASDLYGRSIQMPPGEHLHGYSYFLRDLGTYEVTFRVFDATGQFATDANGLSEVSFLVTAVPSPNGLAAMAVAGLAMTRRRR